MKKLTVFMLGLSILAGCIEVENVQKLPRYSVYGIISPKDSLVHVFVGHTYALDQAYPVDSGKYVKGALVSIFNAKGEEKKLYLSSQNKVYSAENAGFILPDAEYKLQVVISADTFRSQAKTPPPTRLSVDTAYVAQGRGNLIVSWSKRSDNRGLYRLTGLAGLNSSFTRYLYWGSELGLGFWETNDLSHGSVGITSPIGNFELPEDGPKGEVRITLESLTSELYTFSENLEAYQLRNEFSKKFGPPLYLESNIPNCLGFFGAKYQEEKIIVLNNNSL